MLHRIKSLTILIFLVAIQLVASQEKYRTFVAKEGDGIISILRREGLELNTYYQEFLDLNQDLISNGSMLKLGKTYRIPNADDSFTNMGRKIVLNSKSETSIFDTNLAALKKKDTLLKNTVYYLLFDRFDTENLNTLKSNSSNKNEIALSIAKGLLEQGARVFIFENEDEGNSNLGDYVSAINIRYLKFKEEHQRLLVFDIETGSFNGAEVVSIEHNENSKYSKRFANSIEKLFKSQKIQVKNAKNKDGSFIDKTNIYLASNALPIMTYIKMDGQNKSVVNTKESDKNKAKFVDVITSGIQIDYSNIQLVEQD